MNNLQHMEFVWAQKYRPSRIEDCILPDSIKSKFTDFIAKGEIPHFIFYGTTGVGKTTVAIALCNEIGADYIIINGSEESGIDVLRNKIKAYASSVSLEGNKKVIIIDEADYLQAQSTQPALRGMMEEFSSNCRFILTCNYKNRLIPALQESRTTQVEFKIKKEDKPAVAKQIFTRCCEILDKEGIEYDKKVVVELIKKCFPDFRRLLNELQLYSSSGKIDSGILVDVGEDNYTELFGFLKGKKFNDMRKWVAKNSDLESAVLLRKLFDSCDSIFKPESIPQLVLLIADYQFKGIQGVDPEVNNTAALTDIMYNCEFLE